MSLTLAECLGVKTRWQALACLNGLLSSEDSSIQWQAKVAMDLVSSRETPPCAFTSRARLILKVVRDFKKALAKMHDPCLPWITDVSFNMVRARASVLKMLASEMLAEAKERASAKK